MTVFADLHPELGALTCGGVLELDFDAAVGRAARGDGLSPAASTRTTMGVPMDPHELQERQRLAEEAAEKVSDSR